MNVFHYIPISIYIKVLLDVFLKNVVHFMSNYLMVVQQEANLFEKLGEIDKAITIFQNIINCYESFDMKDRIDILKDELKKLRKKS